MSLHVTGVAAELGEDEGLFLLRGEIEAFKIDMLTQDVAFLLPKPPGRGVPDAGGVQRLQLLVNAVGIVLPPALVKDGIVHNRGVVLQQGDRFACVPLKLAAACGACLMGDAALLAEGGQGGVHEEAVFSAVHHVLKDCHTVLVTKIIEHLGLYLDMLAEHIEAELLHFENIVLIARRGGGEVNAVGIVPLV